MPIGELEGLMFSKLFKSLITLALISASSAAMSYTANKVWFEFRPNGLNRVHVVYTVPELQEFRESFVEFTNRKEAEVFYWSLMRGADFYPPDPKAIEFVSQPVEPEPW